MHASRLTLTALAAAFGLHGAALAADPPPPPAGGSILAWTPEQQRYGYRNMEKVTPVEVVARGAKVRELPLAASQIDPKWTWNGQAQTVDSYMTAMNTSGALSSVVSPLLVTWLLQRFGDWNLALYVMGGLFLMGMTCWLFIDPRRRIFE